MWQGIYGNLEICIIKSNKSLTGCFVLQSFFQKCNFMKHYRQVHDQTVTYKCDFCPAEFTQKRSFDKHAESHAKSADYSCPHCLKLFQKVNGINIAMGLFLVRQLTKKYSIQFQKIQLQRHVKTSHSGLIYRCPFCQMTARHKHSMRRHFERLHNDKKNEWDKTDLINQIVEKTEIIIESPVGVDDTARAGKIVDAGDSQGKYELQLTFFCKFSDWCNNIYEYFYYFRWHTCEHKQSQLLAIEWNLLLRRDKFFEW